MSVATELPKSGSFDALHERNFAIAWGASIVSNSGSFVQGVAIPVVIFKLTGRPTALGLATAAGLGSGMLGTFLAGPLGDRADKRKLLLATNLVLFVLTLGLWALWVSSHAGLTTLYIVMCLNGFVNGVSSPVWQAFQPQLVPRQLVPSAVRLNSTNYAVARTVGPALGTVLLKQYGAGTCFMINAISFLAVVTALVFVRARQSPPRSGPKRSLTGGNPFREFATAWRYMRTRRGLCLAPLWTMIFNAFSAVWMQLTAVVAFTHFGHAEEDGGLLMVTYGLGSILAGVGLGRLGLARSTTAFVATLGAAGGLAATALTHNFTVGLVAFFVLGVGHLANATSLNSAIQVQVDDEYRTRMISMYMQGIFLSLVLGSVVTTRLIEAWGVRASLLASAVALSLPALGARPRGLRSLDEGPLAPD